MTTLNYNQHHSRSCILCNGCYVKKATRQRVPGRHAPGIAPGGSTQSGGVISAFFPTCLSFRPNEPAAEIFLRIAR